MTDNLKEIYFLCRWNEIAFEAFSFFVYREKNIGKKFPSYELNSTGCSFNWLQPKISQLELTYSLSRNGYR